MKCLFVNYSDRSLEPIGIKVRFWGNPVDGQSTR